MNTILNYNITSPAIFITGDFFCKIINILLGIVIYYIYICFIINLNLNKMELNEAFKVIVEKINENFKEGLYDINDAGVIVNSISVVSKALSVVKQPEQTITTSTSEIKDVCYNDCESPEECNSDCDNTEIVDLPELK